MAQSIMSLTCYNLFDPFESDLKHCDQCHANDNLLSVTLRDGRKVKLCGPAADREFRDGNLAIGEYKRFVCRVSE